MYYLERGGSMGSFDPLKVNQPVEIELPNDDKNRYRSRVESMLADKITVASPLKAGSLIPIIPGTIVKVNYTDNVAIYTFTTEVISQNRQNPPTLTLGQPFDVKRIQRRNFVRLDAKLAVTLHKVDENFAPIGESFAGTTVDISGGGSMFGCSTLLHMGEVLESAVYLSENETVKAIGRVVRFVENPSALRNKYSAGLEFTVIEESERDKIIRYIFNRQRELRRKGLL